MLATIVEYIEEVKYKSLEINNNFAWDEEDCVELFENYDDVLEF